MQHPFYVYIFIHIYYVAAYAVTVCGRATPMLPPFFMGDARPFYIYIYTYTYYVAANVACAVRYAYRRR